MNVLAFVVTAVLVPMLVTEFTDWLPWFAVRMIGAAARSLPSAVRSRYAEEWQAELDTVPGSLSKLAFAIRICIGAPATATAVSEAMPVRAMATKAIFDRLLAALGLLALAPTLWIIALAILIIDGRPVFVAENRIGKDGRTFGLLRFRTRVMDAEGQQALMAALNEGAEAFFTIHNAQRVTRTGSWLRRNSLDELPQLVSVLLGDMSFVGPRPALPGEAHAWPSPVSKPGITGLWQITGRTDLPLDVADRLDRRYVEHWSLALDLQILWKAWQRAWRR